MTSVTARSKKSLKLMCARCCYLKIQEASNLSGVAAFSPSRRTFTIRADSFADVLGNEALIAHQTLTLLPNQRFVRFWFFVVIAS